MSRIIHPEDFETRQSRFNSIYDKNKADGKNSDAAPFILQKKLDMEAMKVKADKAATYEKTRKSYTEISLHATEVRDHHFEPVWTFTEGAFQYLKKLYKGELTEMVFWGAPLVGNSKLVYPSEFAKRNAIFLALKEKHNKDVANSALNPYINKKGVDMADLVLHSADALNANLMSENNANLAEDMTKKRDAEWMPVWQATMDITGFLAGLNDTNKNALAVWGVVVDSSAQAARLRTSVIKPAATMHGNSILIGSAFTNIGTTDLHVYRGKSTKGTPMIVKPGEQLGMIKGFSAITVMNPSTLVTGKFTVMANK